MVSFGNFFFKFRDYLFPLVFLGFAVLVPPLTAPGYALALDVAGLTIAIGGQALRAAVIGFAYIKRGGKNKQVYADNLVIEGFFAHSRNPLYVGNLMVLIGLILIHGGPVFVVAGSAFYLFAYRCIVAAEENFLRNKFGTQYDDYCARVNRFLLSFSGLGKSIEGMEYDWKRVVRKEYGSTFTWVSAAILLFMQQRVALVGLEAAKPHLYLLASAFGPLAVLYIITRVAKKKRWLGRD